jgi:2-amino-4-hydroxy-6-hydroxymethyldihydropteridine diphosphokinase
MLLILGLGTNLGDKFYNLKKSITLLKSSGIFISNNKIIYSKIYQTPALLKDDSPAEWSLDYLNMNISGESNLSAELILQKIQQVEKNIGRTRNNDIWAPRLIDIDILLYGDLILNSQSLTIPHKELCNRSWCLKPITELSEKIIDPISKLSFNEIYHNKFKNNNLIEYEGKIND